MEKQSRGRFATLPLAAAMLPLLLLPIPGRQAFAQSHGNTTPYDSIAADGETYAGPGRGSAWDETGSTVYIGLLAPVHGPNAAEGEALVVAANMALKDSMTRLLPGGRHVALAIGDESGPAWGQISGVILQLVQEKNVVALITSTDGRDAHVSEQVGNRIGIPILTLSNDATTTEINIPWIFRIGPSDADEAQAIAANIYHVRGFKRMMVIFEQDHDGKNGAAAMRRAAIAIGATAPEELSLDPQKPDFSSVIPRLQACSPRAIVLWTTPATAQRFFTKLQAAGVSAEVFCSAQAECGEALASNEVQGKPTATWLPTWTIRTQSENHVVQNDFAARYRQQTGKRPSAAATEAYDAVCLTVKALRQAGPNRARVRDQLAGTRGYSGASGIVTFDRQGNNSTQVHLVKMQRHPSSAARGASAE